MRILVPGHYYNRKDYSNQETPNKTGPRTSEKPSKLALAAGYVGLLGLLAA